MRRKESRARMGGDERMREVKWVGVRERTNKERADGEMKMKGEVKINSERQKVRREGKEKVENRVKKK